MREPALFLCSFQDMILDFVCLDKYKEMDLVPRVVVV